MDLAPVPFRSIGCIDEVFPLADAREAFERSLGDHRPGKIVLRVADESADAPAAT